MGSFFQNFVVRKMKNCAVYMEVYGITHFQQLRYPLIFHYHEKVLKYQVIFS